MSFRSVFFCWFKIRFSISHCIYCHVSGFIHSGRVSQLFNIHDLDTLKDYRQLCHRISPNLGLCNISSFGLWIWGQEYHISDKVSWVYHIHGHMVVIFPISDDVNNFDHLVKVCPPIFFVEMLSFFFLFVINSRHLLKHI